MSSSNLFWSLKNTFSMYVEPKKNGMDDLIYKEEIETGVENKYQGGRGEWMNWEVGINIYTLLILCIK